MASRRRATHTLFGHPPTKSLTDQVLSDVSRTWMFVVFLPLAYLLGYTGFKLAWFLVLFFFAWKVVNHTRCDRKDRLRKVYEVQELTPLKPGNESCNWVAMFFYHIWPHFNVFMSETLREYLEDTFKHLPQKYSLLQSITIKKCTFGRTPIMLTNINGLEETFDADATYDGEAELEIDVKVGGRLINWTLPFRINNLSICGRLRLAFFMTSRYPFVYKIDYSFKRKPSVFSFDVSLFGFHILELPVIPELIRSILMERVIAPNLVLPDVCSYYLNLHPPAGEDNPYAAPPLFDPFDVSCNVPMNPTEYPPKKPSRPFSPCPFGTSSVPSPVLSLQSHFSNGEDLKSSKQGHTNLLTILKERQQTGKEKMRRRLSSTPSLEPPENQFNFIGQELGGQGPEPHPRQPTRGKRVSVEPTATGSYASSTGSFEFLPRPFPDVNPSESAPKTKSNNTNSTSARVSPDLPPLPADMRKHIQEQHDLYHQNYHQQQNSSTPASPRSNSRAPQISEPSSNLHLPIPVAMLPDQNQPLPTSPTISSQNSQSHLPPTVSTHLLTPLNSTHSPLPTTLVAATSSNNFANPLASSPASQLSGEEGER